MGSYLQGFPFNLIRKRTAAALSFLLNRKLQGCCDEAGRQKPAGGRLNWQRVTVVHPWLLRQQQRGQATARSVAESSFSMHVTCINDAEWCVFSPCRMLVLLRKRHVRKWSLEWCSGWNERKWNEKKKETGKRQAIPDFIFFIFGSNRIMHCLHGNWWETIHQARWQSVMNFMLMHKELGKIDLICQRLFLLNSRPVR